jgi:hypothetical protein
VASIKTRRNSVLKSNTNVGIYGLAVLPVDYLSRLGDPFEQLCKDRCVDPVYHEVFTTGIKAYQLVTYRKLLREHYGRGVANQVSKYQQRLLEKEESGDTINYIIKLINIALDSGTVAADTDHGSIDIPIEMNVALLLLLDAPSSPHRVSHPDQYAIEIGSMALDIDWLLSNCLCRAREDVHRVFAPLLTCLGSGVRIDFARAYLKDKLVTH